MIIHYCFYISYIECSQELKKYFENHYNTYQSLASVKGVEAETQCRIIINDLGEKITQWKVCRICYF